MGWRGEWLWRRLGMVVLEELEALVRRDLMEVVDAEFERIASIYRDINKLCLDVDVVRVHPHVEVHDLGIVMDGLLAKRSMYFIFTGDRVVKVECWEYDVIVIGDGHEHVIAVFDVCMFGDRCFITKDVDEYELDGAVRDIVSDLQEGLRGGESLEGGVVWWRVTSLMLSWRGGLKLRLRRL